MARAAPRVCHARRALVTDGVHSRAQGLAVQIPDDVCIHHIPPGRGMGLRLFMRALTTNNS